MSNDKTPPWTRPEEICTTAGNLLFLDAVRRLRECGFGWMQQVIELEWRRVLGEDGLRPEGAWGPWSQQARIQELEAEVARLETVRRKLVEYMTDLRTRSEGENVYYRSVERDARLDTYDDVADDLEDLLRTSAKQP